MRFALDFRVPTHRHTGGAEEAHVFLRPIGPRDVTKAHPVVPVFGPEILVPNPMARCMGVSSPRPLPQQEKDLMVDLRKSPLAGPLLVILRPASNHGIELQDQVASDGLLVTLDHSSDSVQEGVHVFLGGRAEQLAAILAHMDAEKVKPVLEVRDLRLLMRKREAPLRQKLLDTGLDLLLQECFGTTGDDAIIRKSDHMDFRPGVPLEGWKGPFDVPFQAVEGQIHDHW